MSLISTSICISDIPKDKFKQHDNGKIYLSLVVAKRKETSQYGETHTVFVGSTKEERESGAQTIYCGGGKEYFPQNQTPTAESINEMQPAAESDLPF